MRRVVPPLLFPLVLLAMVAYALATPSLELAGALGLPEAADTGLRPASAILLFYALIAALERLFPHRAEWNRSHGDVRTDFFHLLFTGTSAQALVGALVLGPLTLLSGWVARTTGGPLWPLHWPLLAQLGLALVLGELGHYAFHRVSHESPWVWRLHAAHHSAPRLYWLNATRFHVFDLFLIISFESLPLALLGAGAEVLGPYLVFRAVYGQLQHCNVEMPTPRWIDWLWSSPNVHRWHHSTDSREGNHNYGAVLNVWDHASGASCGRTCPSRGRSGSGGCPASRPAISPSSSLPSAGRRSEWPLSSCAAARCAPRAAGGRGTAGASP
jgi:sterol desaturase/sphingolipid hydroxylase (fatty acid hydroxylase superfamily)